jgi:hypothetical protein
MEMGKEKGPDGCRIVTPCRHAYLELFEGKAGIDQKRLAVTAEDVAVPAAA